MIGRQNIIGKPPRPPSFLCLLLAAALAGGFSAAAAEIKPADDAPQPLSPAESLKRFKLPPGFRIELAASEPLLADPVAMAFDARGRILVCEIHGFNLEGHYDVMELNKTGVLDHAVRRVPASKEAQARAEQETYGTVKLLEDTNGDGRADRMTVLADRLPPCYGIVPARDGAIVLCAPDIIYLADRDGDGRAETRETLFTGFGIGELWTRISNPQWGVDNWIYAACGAGSAGTIRGPRLAAPVPLGNTGFRFKSDGSQFEPVSGGTSGFGLALSDWDDRFLVANQQHALYVAPLPYRYLARNPHYAAPGTVLNISTYGHPAQVYPIAPPDPWRLKRSLQPEWVKFYGAAEANMGLVTAACAPLIYRADQFPPEYRDNHFSCECAYNLIHRCRLEVSGLSYKAFRTETNAEFLASTEQWFRPVNLALGPEGALYIVDMYREIIEDYSAIPRYLQQQYGLIKGHDRGRIWRVVYGRARGKLPAFQKASAPELVQALNSSNAWQRLTAQRLLVEGREVRTKNSLAALLANGATAQARLHAFHTLDGLGVLTPAHVETALSDAHAGIRLHALRLAEPWLDQQSQLLEKVLRLVDDPDVKVRLQAAFTLGETREARKFPALAALAAREGDDRWMQAAIISSAPDSAGHLLQEILPRAAGKPSQPILKSLAAVVGARQEVKEISDVLHVLAGLATGDGATIQTNCLAGLIEGLRRGKPVELTVARGQIALLKLLTSARPTVRGLALQTASLLKLTPTPEMNEAYRGIAREALDESRALPERQSALALLARAPFSVIEPVAKKLLDPVQSLDLQLAAVALLAASDDPATGPALLADWNRYSPKLQTAVLDAIFRQQQRLTALLDAIEKGALPRQCLDALRRSQLLAYPDESIRRRAETLLARQQPEPDQQQVLARFQAALSQPRDASRGKPLFQEHCSRCHSINGEGGRIGPDMGGAKGRADETMLLDLFQPSDQITIGYRSYTVVTLNGDIFTGILSAETATSVTLPGEDGTEQTVLRKDIKTMQVSDISLMPANFAELLQPQDVADVLGYIREALGAGPPAVLTLFEDDRAFAAFLKEGDGTATVVASNVFSGSAALLITPPQRFSVQITNWQYRITENPGPGEYRFLQFAWQSASAHGVMLELAADGQWPPPDKPLRRYYAGKNTSGWQAQQIAPTAPRQWTLVTVDLWKDFGSFTLTGLAPTAMGGPAYFDALRLLRAIEQQTTNKR